MKSVEKDSVFNWFILEEMSKRVPYRLAKMTEMVGKLLIAKDGVFRNK